MNNYQKNKIYIIVNPIAGSGKATKLWNQFKKKLNEAQVSYEYELTKYKNHATSITISAIEKKNNFLGVFGGDGTINEVIQGIFMNNSVTSNEIAITFFPAGSSCDFERKFDRPKEWIQKVIMGDTKHIDVFKVECIDFSGNQINRFIINNSSIGIISLANEKFNNVNGITKKIKRANIDLGAIICGLQAIKEFKPFNVKMQIDNETIINTKLSNITIFKTSYFGGGMNYGIKPNQSDGLLSLAWLDNTTKLELSKLIPSLYTGNILKNKKAHYKTCQELSLHTNDNVIVETDGENIGLPPVKYTILKKALKVII